MDEQTRGEHNIEVEVDLDEFRVFPPSAEFASRANVGPEIYAEAAADPVAWWAEKARSLTWETPFTRTLEWDPPFATWFDDGTLNASVSCVDRHVAAGRGDTVAFHWVGEPEGDRVDITYTDLLERVSRAAHALESMGVASGDRVAVYMPMIPEAVVALLACARIGAVHSVTFGGFTAEALAERILDAGPETVARLKRAIENSKTLVWNGPLGVFETPPFDAATNEAAQWAGKLCLEGKLVAVAGGGDTVAALHHAGVASQFTFVSTAGGAFLEWMEGKDLPGVSALKVR